MGGVLLGVIVPIAIFLVMVAEQVVQLSQIARPWVENNAWRFTQIDRLVRARAAAARAAALPRADHAQAGELASEVGSSPSAS